MRPCRRVPQHLSLRNSWQWRQLLPGDHPGRRGAAWTLEPRDAAQARRTGVRLPRDLRQSNFLEKARGSARAIFLLTRPSKCARLSRRSPQERLRGAKAAGNGSAPRSFALSRNSSSRFRAEKTSALASARRPRCNSSTAEPSEDDAVERLSLRDERPLAEQAAAWERFDRKWARLAQGARQGLSRPSRQTTTSGEMRPGHRRRFAPEGSGESASLG